MAHLRLALNKQIARQAIIQKGPPQKPSLEGMDYEEAIETIKTDYENKDPRSNEEIKQFILSIKDNPFIKNGTSRGRSSSNSSRKRRS